MNYYEHHIGDYAEATSHLTFIEDAAYSRMIRKYYAQEKPLPADLKAVQRLVGARTKEEREAVDTVLNEFFQLEDDGWHNGRCDEELSRYLGKTEGKDAKRENEKERQRRHRQRRKELFEALREHGEVPAFDMPTDELVTLLSRVMSRVTNNAVTEAVTRDATATQSPVTSHQSPDLKPKAEQRVGSTANNAPSDVGALCVAMRAAGIDAQPADPRMIALAEQGTLPETVTAACAEAKRSKPDERIKPGYVVAILERWAKDAAALNVTGAARPQATAYQARQANTESLLNRIHGKPRHERTDDDIIDLNERPAGNLG